MVPPLYFDPKAYSATLRAPTLLRFGLDCAGGCWASKDTARRPSPWSGARNGGPRERGPKNRRAKHGANNRPSSKRRHPPGSCVYGILPLRAVIDVATVEVRLGRPERSRHSHSPRRPVVSNDGQERGTALIVLYPDQRDLGIKGAMNEESKKRGHPCWESSVAGWVPSSCACPYTSPGGQSLTTPLGASIG